MVFSMIYHLAVANNPPVSILIWYVVCGMYLFYHYAKGCTTTYMVSHTHDGVGLVGDISTLDI